MVTGSLYADASWPFVCSLKEISAYFDDRYFATDTASSNGTYPTILLDTQSVKIDKKKKTIEVWTIWLASEYGREKFMQTTGKTDPFGSMKRLNVYDYGLRRVSLKSAILSNCDGGIINVSEKEGEWQSIAPNSVDDSLMQDIIKKYNLK